MRVTEAFPEPNHTQVPNSFFPMIADKNMTEAEIRVTLIMIRNTFGFHRDSFKMGVHKLALAAGLSDNGAKAGAEAAEARGTFRRANPDSQKEAEWELVVGQPMTPSTIDPKVGQPMTHQPSTSDPQVRVKESINKSNKKYDEEQISERLKIISKLYEGNITMITAIMADTLKDAAENTEWPTPFFEKAFAASVENNARNWSYIKACLNNMSKYGIDWKPSQKGKQNAKTNHASAPNGTAQSPSEPTPADLDAAARVRAKRAALQATQLPMP